MIRQAKPYFIVLNFLVSHFSYLPVFLGGGDAPQRPLVISYCSPLKLLTTSMATSIAPIMSNNSPIELTIGADIFIFYLEGNNELSGLAA